jgi:hypothetical protein
LTIIFVILELFLNILKRFFNIGYSSNSLGGSTLLSWNAASTADDICCTLFCISYSLAPEAFTKLSTRDLTFGKVYKGISATFYNELSKINAEIL